ncbi:MAG: Holliday junction branch migration protein RuvA [Clostridiales Family XIII bacterium]|jgi:Holliday junction DNA helicase RuvA|nr:Holliday junction branch migration protein RuvA [Clostridiales Family XIII bacterium]
MIAYISGRLLERLESSVVVDTGGIGYEVFVPQSSAVYLRKKGDELVLHTVQIVKEDDISLYGFEDTNTLKLFRKLITVSGVGAKAGLAILSALSTDDVVKAIVFEDSAMLTMANGIGKKSAERIILELKDKLSDISGVIGGAKGASGVKMAAGSDGQEGTSNIAGDAIEVLISLGYSRAVAASAVMGVGVEAETVSTEELIKLALKSM